MCCADKLQKTCICVGKDPKTTNDLCPVRSCPVVCCHDVCHHVLLGAKVSERAVTHSKRVANVHTRSHGDFVYDAMSPRRRHAPRRAPQTFRCVSFDELAMSPLRIVARRPAPHQRQTTGPTRREGGPQVDNWAIRCYRRHAAKRSRAS